MSNLVPFSHYVEVNPARYIPEGLELTSKVSFVPMADVSESGYWFGNQVRRLNEVASGFTNFKNKDVLVAKITPCFENGKGAFVADLENGVGFGSTEFHVLRAKQGTCARFIFHVTQWPQFRLSSERFMTGSAGQKRVQTLAFSQFEIADFGEDEQKTIATILDTLDTQIRQTEAIIAKLQQVKQGLLHDLLTRGIDENGQLRPPYEQAPELYKASPLGWIPKGWEVQQLGELTALITSGSRGWAAYYAEEGPLFLRSQNIRMGRIDLSDRQCVNPPVDKEGQRTRVEPLDLLVTITGNGVGNLTYLSGDWSETAFVSQHVALVRFVHTGLAKLVNHYLVLGGPGRRQIVDAQYGQSKPGLNLDSLKDVCIPNPPSTERDEIVAKIDTIDARVDNEVSSVEELRSVKSGLMDDLLTGRVRVTELIEQEQQAS